MTKKVHDPKMYRECSEPFESTTEGEAAIDAFFEDLYALRAKHKIANVLCVLQDSFVTEDGDEAPFYVKQMCGDSTRAEGMAAWVFGHEQAERKRAVADLMSQKNEVKR